MENPFRIHFRKPKNSKRYNQAIELAELASGHEVNDDGYIVWHVVSFNADQIDLMAAIFKLTKNFRLESIGAGKKVLPIIDYFRSQRNFSLEEAAKYIRETYINTASRDHLIVGKKLMEARYLGIDFDASIKTPSEHIQPYQTIKRLIVEKDYSKAIDVYYEHIGDNYYSEIHQELVYLKRLAGDELTGRDYLFFSPESSRSDIVKQNLAEYVDFIDITIKQFKKSGYPCPIEILREYVPTMEDMIDALKKDWHQGVYIEDGKLKRDYTPVTHKTFSSIYSHCHDGRLFEKYPDQMLLSRIVETPDDWRYHGLWITYPQSFIDKEIYQKGLHINMIDAYHPKEWRLSSIEREPDFLTLNNLSDIYPSSYGVNEIRYTGRTHAINGRYFYEVDIIRGDSDKATVVGNPFQEIIQEMLREAENLLRESKSLPRIGEGWISETLLYNLVKEVFQDTQHHARPSWLKPMHLDVYVPSQNLAFEYQGQQHFKPIDFFGGQEAFEELQKRDKRKLKKCKANGVKLLYWKHDEQINKETLEKKLKTI